MRSVQFGPAGKAACLAVLVTFSGCASAAAPGTRDPAVVTVVTGSGQTWEIQRGADIRVNRTVTITRDQAWAALPRVYETLGLEPDVRDPAGRTLGVSEHRFSREILNRQASDFFDCGLDPGLNRPLADQVPINARVTTQVLATEGGAELRTVVEGSARRSGGNAGIAPCGSTGLLEVLLGEMVQRLGAPPG